MDKWMDKWMNEWTNEWMNEHRSNFIFFCFFLTCSKTFKWSLLCWLFVTCILPLVFQLQWDGSITSENISRHSFYHKLLCYKTPSSLVFFYESCPHLNFPYYQITVLYGLTHLIIIWIFQMVGRWFLGDCEEEECWGGRGESCANIHHNLPSSCWFTIIIRNRKYS